jgi:CTP:molybdopterin cytidylyltransferase MocA
MRFAGVVLAAGAGVRLGTPKALVRDPDGTPWITRAVRALTDGGCDGAVVVLGAGAADAMPLIPEGARAVVAADWQEGIAASIRAGLRALGEPDPRDGLPDAAVLTHVDLPGLPASVVRRLLDGADAGTLRQAAYGQRPGHPVVLGRTHWTGIAARVHGDSGARGWLIEHGVEAVDCTDLFDGADIDTPEQLARHHAG